MSALSPRHYYHNPAPLSNTYVLQPLNGDVDLFVWGVDALGGCVLLCSSVRGTLLPDMCVTPAGPQWIEVRFFSAPVGLGLCAYTLLML